MGKEAPGGHEELLEGRVSNAFGEEGSEMTKEELDRVTRSQHDKKTGKKPDGSVDGIPLTIESEKKAKRE
ncbi:hypothetical protein KKG41_00540 [Patescibacteria group bacterium]|nr:hypothetical protein [Patescibacteria group bacterium]MBU1890303.1 hypothetical protein [Patescibacteria group bacterium]